jgi:ABC-type sugar transport system permease subunit
MLTRRERILLLVPLAVIMLPFLVWPALAGLVYSFTNYAPGQLHLHWVGLNNYVAALSDVSFRAAWRNMLVFIIVAVPADLVIGFCLAWLLREPFRGRSFIRILLLVPWLVSPIASGVMWYFLLNLQWGMVNFFTSWLRLPGLPSPLGLTWSALPVMIATEIWQAAPLAGFLLLPGLLSIPGAQWEYATLEGVSFIDRVRWLVLPWMRPLILAVGLLLTGSTLGAFDSILILTGGGPGDATITPALYSYQQAFQIYYWPQGATSAWFIVLSVILAGLVYLSLNRAEKD